LILHLFTRIPNEPQISQRIAMNLAVDAGTVASEDKHHGEPLKQLALDVLAQRYGAPMTASTVLKPN